VEARPRPKGPGPSDLSDAQAAACRWLVDSQLIRVLDAPGRASLAEPVAGSRLRVPFRLGRIFRVHAGAPGSGDHAAVSRAVTFLVRGLQERQVLPLGVDVRKVARRDGAEVLGVVVGLHEFALASRTAPAGDGLSVRLDSLAPARGSGWFDERLPLAGDSARNGELLRSLCVALRPDVFEEPPPPARSPWEMAERNRQALAVLAEVGAIERSDVERAEDIVRGTAGIAEAVPASVRRVWERWERAALVRLPGSAAP